MAVPVTLRAPDERSRPAPPTPAAAGAEEQRAAVTTVPSTPPEEGLVPFEPATIGSLRPDAPPPAPVRVHLPTGLEAAVVPVGVEPGGELEVPDDVDVVGWYRHGPAPGESAGSAVVSGHVDDANQGLGTFAALRSLGPGDVVEVELEQGRRLRYQVVERRRYRKDRLPREQLFSPEGSPRLVLITCGGRFDRARRQYEDNVVVTATPAP